jgi:hypothetical protein
MKIQTVMQVTFHKNEEQKAVDSIKKLLSQKMIQIKDTGYSPEGIRVITLTGTATA